MNGKTLYDADFAEWADQTAALIRAGRFDEVDSANVAEEIESLGKSERHQLWSRVAQVLEHLLKLNFTSGPLRENNERGWRGAIRRQQGEIDQLPEDSPSLKGRLTPVMLEKAYKAAAGTVAIEYGVKPPARCPFGWGDVLPQVRKRAKSSQSKKPAK
jgi:hypothetical protein